MRLTRARGVPRAGEALGFGKLFRSQLLRGAKSLITRHFPVLLKLPPRILVGKYSPEFCDKRIVFALCQLGPRHRPPTRPMRSVNRCGRRQALEQSAVDRRMNDSGKLALRAFTDDHHRLEIYRKELRYPAKSDAFNALLRQELQRRIAPFTMAGLKPLRVDIEQHRITQKLAD